MWRRLTLLLLLIVVGLAACGGDDDDGGGEVKQPEDSAALDQKPSGGCAEVAQPDPKPDGGGKRPAQALDPDATYDVVLKTSCGDITIRLDQKGSPKTAASFAGLAKAGFFDDTVFHRIVPGFVVQGGDPTATGTGGPGYSTRDVPPAGTTYKKGTVAMAKTRTEPPGTAGSQFYIVTAPDAGLPPEYALVGKVSEGYDVIEQIEKLGTPEETPKQTVLIEKMTIEQG